MLIYDRQIIINYWDECSQCTSILRCIKIHMATCIFIHSLIMHLIVLLLKIKQLKEETSVI